MREEKDKQTSHLDIIALPPLKMVLVHAKDERLNQEEPVPVIKETVETLAVHVEPQALKKIIQHLEMKS